MPNQITIDRSIGELQARKVMTVQEWIGLSSNPLVRARMETDPYSKAYPAMLSHFSNLQLVDWNAAVVGLHIVYGWMPTIPRLGGIMIWDDSKRQALVASLTKAKEAKRLSDHELEVIKLFANNSMVGASKLLHFLAPKTFPIWDSRVAKSFLKKAKVHSVQVSGVTAWNFYQEALSQWKVDDVVKAACKDLRQIAPWLAGVSDLRLIELVMFHNTVSKRKGVIS